MNMIALRLAALQLAAPFATTLDDLIGMADEIVDYLRTPDLDLDPNTEGMSEQ